MDNETPIHEDGSPEVDNAGDPNAESTPVDPRMAVMEAVAGQADEERTIPVGTRQEDMPMGEPVNHPEDMQGESADLEPGLAYQEQMHEEPGPNALPEELADDPLAEFIELNDAGEPMFRTVVNGQLQLIPLDRARAQVQKQESADQRLQSAHQWQTQLEQRESAVAAREAQLKQSLETMHDQAAPPSQVDAGPDDETLEGEARKLVKGLFTGSEDEAAAQLVELLKANRGAGTATPQVDPEQIAQQAVAAARQQLTAEQRESDVRSGFEQFEQDYPEIAADDQLFRFADSMTDAIVAEHPDWMPSKVMLEAGKRVREWVKSQRDEAASEQPDRPDDRQERKRQLRPIPRARQGVPEAEPAERPDTPADMLADIRKSRGQVV